MRYLFPVVPQGGTKDGWSLPAILIRFLKVQICNNVPETRHIFYQKGQTFKIQLKDEWLYCSHGIGGMLLKTNSGAKQLTIRYQAFFLARPQRQSLRSGGSGLPRNPII
jgi:hypothetical protein